MLKLFECFAGYGGASFALNKANISFECVGYSEIDKYAIKIYDNNFPNINNYGDIKLIKPNLLPDFDILTGGFPCQDISNAGKCDLSKGRTLLVYNLLDIIKYKKPKYILLENVSNILNNKFKWFLDDVLLQLNNIGYNVMYKKLNTKNYGIPQNRPRVWFVCIRKDISNRFSWDIESNINLNINDILEKNVDKKYYVNENWLRWFNSESGQKRKKMGFLTVNKPIVNCLTTRQYISWGGNFRYDNFGYRKLTPKECFRLQGFIDDEINLNDIPDNKLYVLNGNGWDINIASMILKNLIKQ